MGEADAKMKKRVPPRKWTVEDEAYLRKLWADGFRDEELASHLDRTVLAVQARSLLIGLRLSSRHSSDGLRLRAPMPRPQKIVKAVHGIMIEAADISFSTVRGSMPVEIPSSSDQTDTVY